MKAQRRIKIFHTYKNTLYCFYILKSVGYRQLKCYGARYHAGFGLRMFNLKNIINKLNAKNLTIKIHKSKKGYGSFFVPGLSSFQYFSNAGVNLLSVDKS